MTKQLIEKIEGAKDRLNLQENTYDKVIQWFSQSDQPTLFQMNAYSIADQLGMERKTLLNTFIQLAKEELLDVNWEYHCPSCNGVPEYHSHLSEVTGNSSCAMCEVDFSNTIDQNIGVTFTVVESLIPIPHDFHTERNKMMEQAINGTMEDKQNIAAYLKQQEFVSAMDCLHMEGFKDLFDNDTLPVDESLSIKNVTLMFTDIKGSTSLYARVGDAKAYKLIRDHFEILFRIVEKNNGIVIKTIGDAVMASFKNPVDSTRTALSIYHAFKEFDTQIHSEKEFLVKVGIHKGPALMVTLNNRIDYFGQTVNMAARIQGKADNNQIIISEKMRNEKEVITELQHSVKSLQPINVQLKGIEGRSKLFILNFKDEDR